MRTARLITIWLAFMAVIALVTLAEDVLRSWGVLVPAAAAVIVAYGLGRAHGRRRAYRALRRAGDEDPGEPGREVSAR